MRAQTFTSVCVQTAVNRSLSKLPHMQTSSSWHGSFALLCSTAESYPGHLSFYPWRWTDCVPESVPSFSCYHSHYILQGYSITVTSFMLHIHQFRQFVRILPSTLLTYSQMTPKYNPLMHSRIWKHPVYLRWIYILLSRVINDIEGN